MSRSLVRSSLVLSPWRSLWIWGGLLICCGCGGAPAAPTMDVTVKGKVTLNGQPAGPIGIQFYSMQHGNVAKAEADKEGAFTLSGPIPAGEYILYLTGPAEGKAPSNIPPIYFSDTSTDQRVTLNSGANDVALALKR